MRSHAALCLALILIVPKISSGQEPALEASSEANTEASSRQILRGVAADPDVSRGRHHEIGFFRWGVTMELGAAVPIGDLAHSVVNAKEFTSTFDLGFDLSVDVSQFFQASYVMRFGFGGVDRDLYSNAIDAALGFTPDTIRSTLVQSGVRVRFFLFDARHIRPYLLLECVYTTMGLTARHEIAVAEDPGETDRVTVLEHRYRAMSVTPGAGLRYDIGFRARPGLPRFSRVLSIYLQASYSFNFWRELRLDIAGSPADRVDLDEMKVGHVRVTAGVGVMF